MRAEVKKLVAKLKAKNVIIHPLAFAVFPILSLYAKNVGKGFLRETIGIAMGTLVLAALIWLFVHLLVKDRNKSAAIISAFSVLFFSYGHAISTFRAVLGQMQLLDRAGFLVEGNSGSVIWLAIWGILFAVVSYLVVRTSDDLRTLTRFLNIVALTLVVIVALNFVVVGVNMFLVPRTQVHVDEHVDDEAVDDQANVNANAGVSEFIRTWERDRASDAGGAASGSSPDIYYIILDMYARADILREVYQFDNSAFLSFLADAGFYVADKSRANYQHTTHSLSSSLNFMYLDDVAERVGTRSKNFGPFITMVRNSKLIQYLRNRGYTFVAFSTGYEITEARDADIYMSPPEWHPSHFQEGFMALTPLTIFRKTQDDLHRERVLYTLDHLADATRIDSPTFVFAHVPCPHPPYVFGANGSPVRSRPEEEYEYDETIEAYRNQVAFLNTRVQAAVKKILLQSSEPPIIIIQADHGTYTRKCYYAGRFSILNAYYFPNQNYDALYESITPVNTFRVILNGYFGEDYEILEDRSYFSDYWDSPYLFIDVTDEVLSGN